MIKSYLLDDEKIIASVHQSDKIFYATNYRFIRYQGTSGVFGSDQFDDISHNEVTSISLREHRGSKETISLGITMLIIGIFIYVMKNTVFLGFTLGDYTFLGVLSFLMGIIMIYRGISSRESYFEFNGPGILRDEERSNWRISSDMKRDNIDQFFKTERSRTSWRGSGAASSDVRQFVKTARELIKPEVKKRKKASIPSSQPPFLRLQSISPSSNQASSTHPSLQMPLEVSIDDTIGQKDEKKDWAAKLFYNKGIKDSKSWIDKPVEEMERFMDEVKNDESIFIQHVQKMIDVNDRNFSHFKLGYLDGIRKILNEIPDKDYEKGYSDSKLWSDKKLDEIKSFIEAIEKSDPSLLDILSADNQILLNDKYREGYRARADRVVDGKTAVILVGEDERRHHVPADKLPGGAREGSWLRVRVEGGEIVVIDLDQEETDAVRKRIEEKLERLRVRSQRGN